MLDQMHQLKLRLGANEFLLQATLIRLMLLDPGFAQDARGWVDHYLGQFSASEQAAASDRRNFTTIREVYLLLLKEAEKQAEEATRVPKPKSIRRRIFEWLERG